MELTPAPVAWTTRELEAGMTVRAVLAAAQLIAPDPTAPNPAAGTLHRVRRGRYADGLEWAGADEFARHRTLMFDVVRSAGKDAVLSHLSAAVVHDLELPDGVDLSRVNLTWPNSRGRGATTNVRPHRAQIDEQDITMIDEMRVTTLLRTIYDLARTEDQMVAVSAADSALRRRSRDREAFEDLLLRHRGRPGSSMAREVLGFADERARGAGQSQVRVLFARIGLPVPELRTFVVHPALGRLGPVDFQFAGYDTWAAWHADALNGSCPERTPMTEAFRDMGRQLLWVGPTDLLDPATVLARFSRTFTVAGHRRWLRLPPRLLARAS